MSGFQLIFLSSFLKSKRMKKEKGHIARSAGAERKMYSQFAAFVRRGLLFTWLNKTDLLLLFSFYLFVARVSLISCIIVCEWGGREAAHKKSYDFGFLSVEVFWLIGEVYAKNLSQQRLQHRRKWTFWFEWNFSFANSTLFGSCVNSEWIPKSSAHRIRKSPALVKGPLSDSTYHAR